MATVKHVVLDSGAFLRNAPVQNIGEKLYTISDVIHEIRDKATRQRLQVLPYELHFREPTAEAIKMVTDFSKKTGDYRSLSAVDIRVMALVYQLEKEFCGTDHIKTEPEKKVAWLASGRPLEKATEIAGFFGNASVKKSSSRTVSECSANTDQLELRSDEVTEGITAVGSDEVTEGITAVGDRSGPDDSETSSATEDHGPAHPIGELYKKEIIIADSVEEIGEHTHNVNHSDNKSYKQEESFDGETVQEDAISEETDSENEGNDDEEQDEEGDDDDGGGWITPSNIKAVKEKMGGEGMEKAEIQVGCLTTDFAMQNVLIQMGLNVLSVDGMLIKRAKSFVLRCFSCMKITTNVQKLFCPHCGNKTLTKVSMTVNEDGSVRYFLSRRRPVNTHGLQFRLPLPKGGKHVANPILFEDQQVAHNRIGRKARAKQDVFDPDYVVKTSPFVIHDVTSRAAQLGINSQRGQVHYWDKRNPNEVRKRGCKKK
ncbi:RNA-binding protein NOB1-like [Dreissena polymorpha]|uniref:RNA-binding protein NOB1 n=1 Tax=Dreissena polymorpha TaxID=45954 RepID=A0A9D4IDJ2_DREPO|nr:RNA-binding protein NOB1-like [Dreissena polymorpha]KAH3769925.1 hypothetical protein DPMN_171206 [Dreissena polymorpha]